MGQIRIILLNIVGLVFFAAVMEFLLPNSSFRNYIKMTVGVVIVLTILQSVAELLQITEIAWEVHNYDRILE